MGDQSRLYQKNGRYYGDFRDYREVGGRQEALIAEGQRYATKNLQVAQDLRDERLEELERLRAAGHTMEADLRRLGPFVDFHLLAEARVPGADAAEVGQTAHRLKVAVEYFGEGTLLRSIRTRHIQKYVNELAKRPLWKGQGRDVDGCIAAGTQRKYLQSLSKLFSRARMEDVIDSSHRPFSDLMNRPKVEEEEAEWLDAATAVLLLEAARLYEPKRPDVAIRYAFVLIATYLLTGGRPSEVTGLMVEDIDFECRTIRIRPNRLRRLKNKGSRRTIPLWPQLESILRGYLEARGNPTDGILFPSPTRPDQAVQNLTRMLKELALRIGFQGDLTPRIFRHTYCAARVQTLRGGHPITTLEVAKELGHNKSDMVEQIYAHFRPGLAAIKRKPHVEFLLEDHEAELADRLTELREVSEDRNGHAPVLENRVPLETEIAVLEHARAHPGRGPRKAVAHLQDAGHDVSASGVHWILKRYNLHRAEYRRAAIAEGRIQEVMDEVITLRAA